MKKFRRLILFLKNPPFLFLYIVWGITFALIAGTAALIILNYMEWPVYIAYGASAIFFIYSIYALTRLIPGIKARILEKAKTHPFANNLLTSYGFRTVAFSVLSFVINIGFAVFNAVLGVITLSYWYAIFACYYIFLSVLRGVILVGSYQAKKRAAGDETVYAVYKLKLYRMCGIFLLILELALAAAVSLMILSTRPTEYSEIMAITSAAYTFYKIIFAIVNVFKVRRMQDPMLQCFRNINLTDAAVSLLTLQVTLVAVFSDERTEMMNILNAVTGFIVCTLTVVMGILMIVRSTIRLKNFLPFR